MLARRLLILLAVLMALTALAAGVAPRRPPVPGEEAPAPATPSPTERGTVQRTLDAGASGQRVVARVGQTVDITVKSKTLATVSLAEMGTKTAEPDSSAHFELLADVPGSYAIEVLDPDRRIGTLEIREAG